MKNIFFTSVLDMAIDEKYYPVPASKNIPEWYKKTSSYDKSKKLKIFNNEHNLTIKKCMPLFDSLTSGYIIKTYVDVYIQKDDFGNPYYSWPNYEPLSFHAPKQSGLHPKSNNFPTPKWNNAWSIKTPKGYSCLFLPPMNNPNKIFTIFPGIVDTDKYISPVHFPFTLDDPDFEGLIPAGTDICQVIPFKRNSFSMSFGSKKIKKESINFSSKLRSKWMGKYKESVWEKKQYK